MVPVPNKNIYAGAFDHGLGGMDYVRLNASVGEKYYYALYWAMTTTLSVGYVVKTVRDLHGKNRNQGTGLLDKRVGKNRKFAFRT